jgi:hypothetical protein
MRKILILSAVLILTLSSCLKEDELQKVSFSHSIAIVVPVIFSDTSASIDTLRSDGFIIDVQKALNNSEGFDSSKVMYASILKSASLLMADSSLAKFNRATEEMLFSLEREPYRSVIAAYYNKPEEGNFTDPNKLVIPPVTTLAFLNNYEDENTGSDTVYLHTNLSLVDSILDSIVMHLELEFEGTFGSNEHR